MIFNELQSTNCLAKKRETNFRSKQEKQFFWLLEHLGTQKGT